MPIWAVRASRHLAECRWDERSWFPCTAAVIGWPWPQPKRHGVPCSTEHTGLDGKQHGPLRLACYFARPRDNPGNRPVVRIRTAVFDATAALPEQCAADWHPPCPGKRMLGETPTLGFVVRKRSRAETWMRNTSRKCPNPYCNRIGIHRHPVLFLQHLPTTPPSAIRQGPACVCSDCPHWVASKRCRSPGHSRIFWSAVTNTWPFKAVATIIRSAGSL